MHIAKPEQIIVVRFVRLGIKRISEENKQIYLVAGNAACNLLAAAGAARQKAVYVKAGCFVHKLTRRARGTQVMAAHNSAVCNAKLNKQALFLHRVL